MDEHEEAKQPGLESNDGRPQPESVGSTGRSVLSRAAANVLGGFGRKQQVAAAIKCEQCGAEAANVAALKRHKTQVHGGWTVEQIIEARFPNREGVPVSKAAIRELMSALSRIRNELLNDEASPEGGDSKS